MGSDHHLLNVFPWGHAQTAMLITKEITTQMKQDCRVGRLVAEPFSSSLQ
jgi:hypothetical protein